MPALKIVMAGLILLPTITMAACLVPAYKATYDVSAGSASGTLVQTLVKRTDGYQMLSITKAHVVFFSDMITEESVGIVGKHIVPEKYEVVDTRADQPFTVRFDWAKDRVNTRFNKKAVTFKNLRQGTQDNLSYQLVLRQMLAQGKTGVFHFMVPSLSAAKQPELKSVTFSALHVEMLKMPLGDLKTLVLTSYGRSKKNSLEYWFAPQMNYLLVQSKAMVGDQTKALVTIRSYKPDQDSCVIGKT